MVNMNKQNFKNKKVHKFTDKELARFRAQYDKLLSEHAEFKTFDQRTDAARIEEFLRCVMSIMPKNNKTLVTDHDPSHYDLRPVK